MPCLVSRLARSALFACSLLGVALVGGCSQEVRFAPACPQLSLLAEGADMVRFAGGGRDVTDQLLEVRLVGVEARCEPGRRGEVVARIKVWADMARGPAARTRTAEVPYFLAVLRGEQILDRKSFMLQAEFPANVDQRRVNGGEVDLRFPITPEQGADAFKIFVSLQLTEEELAHNRRGDRSGGR